MTSSKPYLIRAIYDWLVDNDLTPYIVVDVKEGDTRIQVPQEHVANGRIILNISPKACRGLHLENDRIIFSARFSGEVKQLFVPPEAVQAIYSKENGRGMVFSEEDDDNGSADPVGPSPSSASGSRSNGKPTLTIVK